MHWWQPHMPSRAYILVPPPHTKWRKETTLSPQNKSAKKPRIRATKRRPYIPTNIKPKLDSLRSKLHLTDKELSKIVVAFPCLLGYSLERRYAPRIGACKEAGIDPRWVLKTISLNDAKFHTALARQSDK